MELTEADRRALAVCRELFEQMDDHKFSPTEVGEKLYGIQGRNRQSYARPGGRAIARLIKAGYVVETWRDYDINRRGRRVLRRVFTLSRKAD